MSKKKINQRVKKMAINSEWARNFVKSAGFATSDIVKDLLPNTTEFAKSTINAVDMVKDIRGNMGTRQSFGTQFKNIPQIKDTSKALKTIVKDIKSGNLYGSDFDDDDTDYGFSDDFFNDDGGVEFLDDEPMSNQSTLPTLVNNLPVAKMIQSSTEATVNTMVSVAEQQMAVETEKMIISHKATDSIVSGLTAMNDNLATLVKFNAESTAKFHAASLKFYDETVKMMESYYKKKDDKYDIFSSNNAFDFSGNLNFDGYVDHVKKNITDMKNSSMIGMVSDTFLDPEMFKMIASNPTKGVTQMFTKKIIPNLIKTSMNKLDESFSAILPALIAKVNSMEGDINLDKVFKIFGVKEKLDYNVFLDRYEKGSISWDGESKKALVEVIPTYLRRIESALTGEKERMYDFDKGEFIGVESASKRYKDKLIEKEASGYFDTKFKLRDYIMDRTNDLNEVDEFGKDLDIYLSAMTKKGSLIKAKEIRERDLFNGDEKRTNRLIDALKSLSVKDLTKMSINELNDSRKATQKYIDEANENANLSGANILYNKSYFDSEGKVKFDPSKNGLFNNKDKFGLTQLDYLRDIRKALIHGIKVFPDGRIDSDSGWNPNIDLMSKEDNENESFKESLGHNVADNNSDDELKKNVFGIDNENVNDLYRELARRNKQKQGKFGLGISKSIDSVTEKVDSFIMNKLFGGGFDDESEEAILVDNEGNGDLRERVLEYFTGTSDTLRKGYKQTKGLLGDVGASFLKGFKDFQISLFGEKKLSEEDKTLSNLTEKIKNRMPKAFKDGLKSGVIKTAIASNLGVLGSLVLPGGPLGAIVLGMGSSLLKQSENFQRWMFGEKDEDGNRTGGFIPKNLIDLYGEYGPSIKKGAIAGILGSFFLPGGPVLGAVTGIGAGLLNKSEAFQKFIFGDDLENKSFMNGAIGKLIKSLSKDKDVTNSNPELATFLGGAGLAVGIAQGVGLLPSMLLPGGPILGSIFGLSAGIVASSEKFQKFLFGEKDEDGQRSGGIISKFTNWFDTAVLGSVKIKMAEANDRVYEFLHEKVLFPIQDALMPIKQLGINVLDDIKESFHSVTDPVVETFKEEVAKPLGKWMKKYFMDPITKTLKGMFKLIGKTIGSVLTSPIKLLTGLGNIADHLNEKRALKEVKENKREQLRELTREEGIKGLFKGIKNLKITEEEREEALTTGRMQYRADREKNKAERKEKLQAELNERQAKRDELRKQFEEDMAFGEGSGWSWSSKRQKEKKEKQAKEKQAWMQEKTATETVTMNQRIKIIKDNILDQLDVSTDQLGILRNIKDLMYKIVTGKDPVQRDEHVADLNTETNDNIAVDIGDPVQVENESNVDKTNIPGITDSDKKGIFKSIIDTLRDAGQSHEDGLEEVPYDSYVAELHEGEMVVPKSPASKMRSMFENNSTFSKMTSWFTKREDKEKQDRDDNALGLTDEEAARMKELDDRERYKNVSKQNVDYIMNKRNEELKEKEEKQWRNSILDAIYAVGGTMASGASKSVDLLSSLGSLFTNLPSKLTSILKTLGITGTLSAIAQVLGTQQYNEYSETAEENNDSILDVYQGEHREERLDADGTYVYDNQLISTGQKLVRPGTMSALLKPEKALYDNVIQPVVNKGGKIINKAVEVGGKVVDYFNPNITKTGTSVLGETYTYTMRNPDATVGGKIMGKVADAATTVKSKSKSLFDEFIKLCKKALQIVANKFVEKFPKLASTKIVSSLDDVTKSLVKNADDIIKKFGKKIAVFIGDVALDVVPVVGQVTELCCTAYDVLTGLTAGNVGNMFGVPASHVDNEMRIICSLLQGLCKFSAMAVLWILNEISTSFLGIDVIQMLARFIYNILPVNLGKKVDLSDQLSGVNIDNMSLEEALQTAGLTYLGVDALYEDRTTGKLKDLSKVSLEDLQGTGISSAEIQELARLQYNQENGTQLDSAAWNDKTNKTWGMKLMDSSVGKYVRGVTTAQNLGLDSTANVTLADRWVNDKATIGTSIVNVLGKITGNEKWKNMTVQDTLSKYAEKRNAKYTSKMEKIEAQIAEKEAKGEDTTKLYKKLDKIKGKLGLSDSEYEEMKNTSNVIYDDEGNILTGDAGSGEGIDTNNERLVPILNGDGTIAYYSMVSIDDTTDLNGLSNKDLEVKFNNTNNTENIPQYDKDGNLVSYTTINTSKDKGIMSKLKNSVSSLFGGNTSSTTSNVDNSNNVNTTNNTGDTIYNTTTNEIDTSVFAPLTNAINSLTSLNMEDNVTEDGKAKTGGVLQAILSPGEYVLKKLLNLGIDVKTMATGEETDPETVNKASNIIKMLTNPVSYLIGVTKDYFNDDEETENKETIKDKLINTKEKIKEKWDNSKLKNGLSVIGGELNDFRSNPIAYLLNKSGSLAEGAYFKGKELVGQGKDWINETVIQPIKEKIFSGVNVVKEKIMEKFGFLGEGIEEGDSAGTATAKVVKNIGGFISEKFNNALEHIKKSFKYVIEEIPKKIIEFKDTLINKLETGFMYVIGAFIYLGKEIPKKVEEIKENVKTGIGNMIENVKETIKEKVNAVKEFFANIDIKKSIQKKVDEIKTAWGNFTGSFSRIFTDLKESFKLPKITIPDLSVTWDNVKSFFKDFAKELFNGGEAGPVATDRIRPKKYRATDSDFINPTNNTTNNNTNNRTNNKFVFYNQSDSRWGSNKIGDSNMKKSGCGPTSLAMAISQLTGEQITPDTVAKLGQEHLPGYSKYSLFPSVAEKLNMNYNEGQDGKFIVDNLQKGIPVILSGRTDANGTPYTSKGHVVTATKIQDGKVFINDPRGKEYSGLYPLSSVLTGLNKGMTVSPSNKTNVSGLSSGQLENGWVGKEYDGINKNELGIYGDVGEYSQFDNMGKDGAAQVTVADRVLSYARAFLANTSKFKYSQAQSKTTGRHGIDNNNIGADCSSFVSHVISVAGDTGKIAYLSQSFWDEAGVKVDDPQIGDVVCQQGHVGLYSGDGKYIHMSGKKDGIKESKAIQNGNNKHRGYKRVLKNPGALVDPTIVGGNSLLGTVVATSSGNPVVSGGTTATTDSSTSTDTTTDNTMDQLGVFGQLSDIGNKLITSIFNGKDAFAETTTSTDSTTNTTTGNPDISNISDNATAVWKFFTGKGYTPEATAGILGNMTQESGVDPNAIQGGGKGPAAGICQWENWKTKSSRWKAMSDYASSKGKDWTDLQSQLEWLDLELQGKDSTTLKLLKKYVGGYDNFKAMTDVKKATKVFEDSFERAGKPNMERRYNAAENYYNQFKSSSDLDITAGTGPSTATAAESYSGDSIPTSLNGWAYYKQGDSQWQEDIDGKKIGPSGCGMASHAMLLTTMFGKQITPVTVGKWARANGHWSNGMSWTMPGVVANLFGLNQPYTLQKVNGASNADLENVKSEIKAGRPVVLSGKGQSKNLNSPFTSGGHIVLAVGVDGNNRLIINDPRGMEYTKAYEDSGVMDIGTGLRGAWSFDMNSNSKIPSNWNTGGSFTPGVNNSTNNMMSKASTSINNTTNDTTTTDSTMDQLGVFGQLSDIGNKLLTSIFNGKDAFAETTTSTDSTTTGGTTLEGGDFIGKVSSKYEISYPSNRGDFISNGASWGDPGGTSYGLPQFATNTGSAKSFAQWLSGKVDTNLGSLTPNTNAYNTEWKAIPNKIGMDKFEQLQGQYAYKQFGEPFGTKWLNATGLTMKNRGFQEMLYSAGIQHGSGTAKKYSTGITSDMSDEAIVDKFYDNRGNLNSTTGSVKTALKNRFAKERNDIKSLLNKPVASTDNITTDDAGKGDGETKWAKGFEPGNSNTKVSYTKDHHAGMGEGETTGQIVNARRNMEKAIRNMTVNNNTTNINNSNNISNACIEVLKTIVQELQSINNNTAATAENVSNIEIVSANTPVNNSTTETKNRSKKDINHSNPNTGYDIARRIASYK